MSDMSIHLLLVHDLFPKSVGRGSAELLVIGVSAVASAFVAVPARAAGGRSRLAMVLAAACLVLSLVFRVLEPAAPAWLVVIPGCVVSGLVIDWRLKRRDAGSI
jgi:hypothetical protein